MLRIEVDKFNDVYEETLLECTETGPGSECTSPQDKSKIHNQVTAIIMNSIMLAYEVNCLFAIRFESIVQRLIVYGNTTL